MKYTHIIFDWDGTLMDSSDKIIQCMQQAAREASLHVPTDAEIKEIIGISLVPAIQKLFSVDQRTAEFVAMHYKQHFLEVDTTPCPLFPGAITTLEILSESLILGVATGKARRGLDRAMTSTESKQFFTDSVCADEAESKPSPDMLLKLLNKWQIDASTALMVGDTVYDMQMAQAIDMPRVAVSFGAHHSERLEQYSPVATIDSVSQLLNIVFEE